MRAVVQRVTCASVEVDGTIVGNIDAGLLVFLGVGRDDVGRREGRGTAGDDSAGAPLRDATRGAGEAVMLAARVANLRIFPDAEGRSNLSLLDTGGAALVISQFTLYADCRRGRRPSFTDAADPAPAEALVEEFRRALERLGVLTAVGRFGAHMTVSLVNDGPYTILLDTEVLAGPRGGPRAPDEAPRAARGGAPQGN
ncbi:MAG: D-aminoacyl-tRNA deacylase [bacterium]